MTSRCSRDGHFAVAVARNVTSPPLLLDSVRLALGNDSECRPVVATPAFALFRFPFTACGTTRRVSRGPSAGGLTLEAAGVCSRLGPGGGGDWGSGQEESPQHCVRGAGLQDRRAHPRDSATQPPLCTGPGAPTSREQEGAPLIRLPQKPAGASPELTRVLPAPPFPLSSSEAT